MSMEYNRKVTPLGEGGAPGKPGDERTMAFGTVTITEGSGADQKVRAAKEEGGHRRARHPPITSTSIVFAAALLLLCPVLCSTPPALSTCRQTTWQSCCWCAAWRRWCGTAATRSGRVSRSRPAGVGQAARGRDHASRHPKTHGSWPQACVCVDTKRR